MLTKKTAFFLVVLFVITFISRGQVTPQQPQQQGTQQKSDDGSFGWKESVLGACLIGIAAYVLKQENEHRKERKEWQDIIKEQFKDAKDVALVNSKATQEVTGVLAEIKIMLRVQNRKDNDQ